MIGDLAALHPCPEMLSSGAWHLLGSLRCVAIAFDLFRGVNRVWSGLVRLFCCCASFEMQIKTRYGDAGRRSNLISVQFGSWRKSWTLIGCWPGVVV